MNKNKFGVCLNCVDGRFQVPVIEWINENYNLDYVDMITELDTVEIFEKNVDKSVDHIIEEIKHSLNNNKSEIIFIVGYGDVPKNLSKHKYERGAVVSSMEKLKVLFPDCRFVDDR